MGANAPSHAHSQFEDRTGAAACASIAAGARVPPNRPGSVRGGSAAAQNTSCGGAKTTTTKRKQNKNNNSSATNKWLANEYK